MKRLIAPVFIVVLTLGSACAKSSHDDEESASTAPSAVVTDSSDVQRGTDQRNVSDQGERVSLRGRIRDLNDRKTEFVLVLPATDAQSEPRTVVVRVDERTTIIAGRHIVRRTFLKNGLECSVEGLRRDDHVLARKITIARSDRP